MFTDIRKPTGRLGLEVIDDQSDQGKVKFSGWFVEMDDELISIHAATENDFKGSQIDIYFIELYQENAPSKFYRNPSPISNGRSGFSSSCDRI
jgi:hypothetical protein